MNMHIEHKALDAAEPGVLLACFQEVRHFTPATRAGSVGCRRGPP